MEMKRYKLGEILTIKNGKDHKELKSGIYPVYGSGGIMRHVDTFLYDKPSILLPRKGTLDNIQYSDKPFWTVDTIYYTEVNFDLANPFYLYNFIKLLDLSNLDSGTGVPSMTFDSYYNLSVNLPPLPTQQKIAAILSSLDNKIALNKKINAKLEAMAKRLYDYWFVQFDFPNGEGKPYKSSGGKMEYKATLKRDIPAGWEVKKLGEVVELLKDGTHNPPSRVENGIALLTGTMFGENFLDYTKATYIAKEDYFIIHSKYEPLENDIIITKIGTLGNINILRDTDIPIAIHCNSALLRFQNTFGFYYPFFFCKSALFQLRLKSVKGQSIQEFASLDKIASILCEIPKDEILISFNKTVKPIMKQMMRISKEIQKLTELRDRLLPLLMNGQVEVE